MTHAVDRERTVVFCGGYSTFTTATGGYTVGYTFTGGYSLSVTFCGGYASA